MRQIYEFLGVEVRFTAPTIGKEYYRTAGRRSYPPVVWAARRAIKRHVPQSKRAKEMVDSFATRRRRARGPDQVVLPERLTQHVAACLADDVARLRPHVAGPFDGWGIG